MATGGDGSDDTFLDAVDDENVGDPEVFKSYYWKTNGYYTAFTMKNRTAIAALKALEQNMSVWHAEKAQLKFEAAERAYETLCEALVLAEHVAGEDKDMTKKVTDRQTAAKGLFEPVQHMYYSLVGKPHQALAQSTQMTASAGAPAQQRMFNDSIKPEKLTLETVPHDFRKWKKGVKAFFKINNLEGEEPEVQNMQFATCLDGEIEDLIAAEVVDSAPVFNTDVGAFLLVEKVYGRRHTDTSKRLDLFMSRQKPGESPMAFAARQNLLYQEADLSSMTVDTYRSFFLIAGISNETLRGKLLEMKNPTHEQLLEKIAAWTVAKSASKAIGESLTAEQKASVKGISGQSGNARTGKPPPKAGEKKSGGSSGGAQKPPANIKNTPASLSGRCGCCGSTSHLKKDCDRIERAKCSTCNRTGHYNNVCLAEYMAWKKKSKKDAKVGKIDTESPGPGTAPPSEDEGEASS